MSMSSCQPHVVRYVASMHTEADDIEVEAFCESCQKWGTLRKGSRIVAGEVHEDVYTCPDHGITQVRQP